MASVEHRSSVEHRPDGNTEITWSDLSPLGMFRLGWLMAQEYSDAEVTINCNATIWVKEEETTIQIRARKKQKTLPDPVTVIAKRKHQPQASSEQREGV